MITLKSVEEIEQIRKAGKISSNLFKELEHFIKEGKTLLEIDKYVYNFIIKNGAKPAFLNYDGFPASACISVNEMVIHGIPNNYVLKDGDIVGVDIGVMLHNKYVSDSAFTYKIGNVTPETDKLVKVTKEALDRGISAAVYGNRVCDISEAVYRHAIKFGFGVVDDYCGHGVGLEVHEEPSIPNVIGWGRGPKLVEGMVIAIEPMINLGTSKVKLKKDGWGVYTADKKNSAHFEHTIAIFKDRTEILTL